MIRFYDAEFYTARLSDVCSSKQRICASTSASIDALRDQAFWHKYFDVLDNIMTTENPMVDSSNARTTPPK